MLDFAVLTDLGLLIADTGHFAAEVYHLLACGGLILLPLFPISPPPLFSSGSEVTKGPAADLVFILNSITIVTTSRLLLKAILLLLLLSPLFAQPLQPGPEPGVSRVRQPCRRVASPPALDKSLRLHLQQQFLLLHLRLIHLPPGPSARSRPQPGAPYNLRHLRVHQPSDCREVLGTLLPNFFLPFLSLLVAPGIVSGPGSDAALGDLLVQRLQLRPPGQDGSQPLIHFLFPGPPRWIGSRLPPTLALSKHRR